MSELRAVFDTSVLVSAVLLPRSVPRQAFDAAISRGVVLISEATLLELDEVLRRPKFETYVSEALRLEFLAALVKLSEAVEVVDSVEACRDPKDDKFLSLAISGKASHVVTGDQDLLVLHPFRGISIVSPQAFLDELKPAS